MLLNINNSLENYKMKDIHNSKLSISAIYYFFYIWISCIIKTQNQFIYPTLSLANTITSSGSSSKILLNDYYIMNQNSQLSIYDIKTKLLLFNLFGTGLYNNVAMYDFDIDDHDYKNLAIISSLPSPLSAAINIFEISNLTIQQIWSMNLPTTNSYNYIQIVKDNIFLLYSTSSSSLSYYRFEQYHISNPTRISSFSTGIQSAFSINIKSCNPGDQHSHFYLAIWKSNCYIQVYYCPDSNTICNQVYHSSPVVCTSISYDITFNSQCTQVLWKSNNGYIYQIIDFSQPSHINIYQYGAPSLFYYSLYFSNNINMDVFVLTFSASQAKYYINSIDPTLNPFVVSQSNISTLQSFGYYWNAYNIMNNIMISVSASSIIYVYEMICLNSSYKLINGLCIFFIQNCISINYPSFSCIQCLPLYNISNDGSCILIQIVDPPSNPSQNSTLNNQNINKLSVQPIYPYQITIGQFVENGFQVVIGSIVGYTIIILKVFPLAFIFLRFINFWAICSLYLLLRIKLPTYLINIMFNIYQQVNMSLFKVLNITFSIDLGLRQKFNDYLVTDFGLSSDFVTSNFENFVILIFSYFLIAILYCMKKLLSKDNFLANKFLQINFPIAIISQYISMMLPFFLNIVIIEYKSEYINFNQKINMSLQNNFLIFSTILSLFSIILMDKKLKNKKKMLQNKKQKIDCFFDCMCNSFLPFTAILGNLYLFFICNTFIYLTILYSSYLESQFRLNKLIRSSYFILFHLSFTLMAIFNHQNYPFIFHHAGLFATLLLLIGAIHQLLNLFFAVIYDFVKFVRKRYRTVHNLQLNIIKQTQVQRPIHKVIQNLFAVNFQETQNNNDQTYINKKTQLLQMKSLRISVQKKLDTVQKTQKNKPSRFKFKIKHEQNYEQKTKAINFDKTHRQKQMQ